MEITHINVVKREGPDQCGGHGISLEELARKSGDQYLQRVLKETVLLMKSTFFVIPSVILFELTTAEEHWIVSFNYSEVFA